MTDTHALCGTSALQNNRIYNLTFADQNSDIFTVLCQILLSSKRIASLLHIQSNTEINELSDRTALLFGRK